MTHEDRARAIGNVMLNIQGIHGILDRLNLLAAEDGPGQRSVRAARDRVADAVEMLGRAEAACRRPAKGRRGN